MTTSPPLVSAMTLASVLAECSNRRSVAVIARYLITPGRLRGVNDFRYRYTPGGDLPVLLLHGAVVNFGANFGHLAQLWHQAKLPLYAVNYGQKSWSLGRVGGLLPMADSAAHLAAVIDLLRARTGAPQVNLVGHSVGALLGLTYLNNYGADAVHSWVGLGPCLRGTTVRDIFAGPKAADRRRILHQVTGKLGVQGLAQIVAGSPFTTAMWQRHPLPPAAVRYLTIRTCHDNSVTPLATQILPGRSATNLLLQELCSKNLSNHRSMITDPCVAELVRCFLRQQPIQCRHTTNAA